MAIGLIQSATVLARSGYPNVADANARLSLTGISAGYRVHQVDNNTNYQYNDFSTTLVAVFIAGSGTAETIGIYTERGTSGGKSYYNLLGSSNSTTVSTIAWVGATAWKISKADANYAYASTDAVAKPWLVTTWTTVPITGDDPVPTTASVTQGELDAGVIATGSYAGVYKVSGNAEARNAYPQIAGLNSIELNSGDGWTFNGEEPALANGFTAFPWQATWNGFTVTRNNVASEANWTPL